MKHTRVIIYTILIFALVAGVMTTGVSGQSDYTVDIDFTEHTSTIWGVEQLEDGRIITSSQDNRVRIWNPDDGSVDLVFNEHSGIVYNAIELDDGRIISVSQDNTARIWNPDDGSVDLVFNEHDDRVTNVKQLEDGRVVTVAWRDDSIVWNPDDGSVDLRYIEDDDITWDVEQLEDGRIITVSNDNIARVWNPDNGSTDLTFSEHTSSTYSVEQLEDGRIVTTDLDGIVKIWNLDTGIVDVNFTEHSDRVFDVKQLDDGRIMTASYDNTVKIWDLDTQNVEINFTEHSDNVITLKQLIDGRIVSGSFDNTAKITNIGADPIQTFDVSLVSPTFQYVATNENSDFISILENVEDGESYDVTWDFGDGNTQTVLDTEFATHSYSSNGQYTVTAEIDGDTYTTDITVTDVPIADFTISPNDIVDGQDVTFNASGSQDTTSAGLEPISQLSVLDGLVHWIPHEEGVEDAAYGATHESGDITITSSHDTSTGTSGAYQPEDELRIVNNYNFESEWTVSSYIDWQDTSVTYSVFGSDNNDGVIIQDGDIKRVAGGDTITVTEFQPGYWQIMHDGTGTFDYYYEGEFVASDAAASIAPSSTLTLGKEEIGAEVQAGSVTILDDVRIYNRQLPSADRNAISDHQGSFEQAHEGLEYFWTLNTSLLSEDRETWDSQFTEGEYEMELEVMDPDGRTDTVASVFEVLGTEKATISSVSPSGLQTSRTFDITADISHSLLDGGNYGVDVSLIRYDVINNETETLIDSQTINSNQTVSYSVDHTKGSGIPSNHAVRERYSYQWIAENQEGIDEASNTQEYSVIGNIYVTNEDGNLITTSTSVTADGTTNTESDGTHDLSNFVISQTDLQADVDGTGYAGVSTYIRHVDRSDVVMLYDEDDTGLFDKDFTFDNSLLGGSTSFNSETTYLVATKNIGGISHTVDAQRFGASDSATLQVRDGDTYTISLVDEDKSRSLGSYTANKDNEDETQTLRPAPIQLDLGEGWQYEVSGEYRNETDDGLINIKFDSGDVNVTSLRIEVENNNNGKIVFQETQSQKIDTYATDVIVDDPNSTYTVSFEVYNEDTGQTEKVSTVVSILQDTILDILPDNVTTWISIILILVIAGTLGMISAPFGIIAVVATGGVFTIIGWLPVSMTVVIQAATIAILFYISTRRTGL